MSEQEKRGPGRPKKGTKSWQPSNFGDIIDKEAGYRYRYALKDEAVIAKRREEGWEVVSAKKEQISQTDSRLDEPHKLTSAHERRDTILMRLDEETAQERDKYYNEKTARLEKRLKSETKKDLQGAPVHGSITKEHKGISTIIE